MLARREADFPRTRRGLPASDMSMRSFDSLSEREILSLAVSLEEEDERIYGDFADGLRENYPATADMFEGMRKERSEEHTSELQSLRHLVCRLLLEKKKN